MFEQKLAKYRERLEADGWTDTNFIARQFVDDHFKDTGVSLHPVQGAIEMLLNGLPPYFVAVGLRKAQTGPPDEFTQGAKALLELLDLPQQHRWHPEHPEDALE